MPPPGGLAALLGGAAPAPPSPFTDLSDRLPHHYQLLDVAASTIEQAINTGGFYQEPKVLAQIRSIHGQLGHVIANRTRDGKPGMGSVPSAPAVEPDVGELDEEPVAPTGGEGYSQEDADTEPE
jgi:hypothetical protein